MFSPPAATVAHLRRERMKLNYYSLGYQGPPPLEKGKYGGNGAISSIKTGLLGFPGSTVVKNPPANAGDTGSIPGPGRSHMPQSN